MRRIAEMSFFAYVMALFAATAFGLASTSCPSVPDDATSLIQAAMHVHHGGAHSEHALQHPSWVHAPPAPENELNKTTDEVLDSVAQTEALLGDKVDWQKFEPLRLEPLPPQDDLNTVSKGAVAEGGTVDDSDEAGNDTFVEAKIVHNHAYRNCAKNDLLGVYDVDCPDPTYAGTHVAITVKGVAKQDIPMAKGQLDLHAMGMVVGTLKFDVCYHMGIKCPLKPGDHYSGTLRYNLPQYPLPGKAPAMGHMTVTDANGQPLGCLEVDIMMASKGMPGQKTPFPFA